MMAGSVCAPPGGAIRNGALATVLLLALLLAACESPSPGRAADGDTSATPARRAGARRADSLAARVAERLIARTDSAFAAVEPLSAGEKRRLRRYLQDEHMARAQRLGISPVQGRRAVAALMGPEQSSVVRLRTNDFYIVDPRMSYAVPLLVPAAAHVLTRVGQRFQRALLARGLPPYRFILTNVLRTGQDQAAMQGTNVNAAQGQSTHEYGTSFDIFYGRFHYAAVHDSLARHAARAPGLEEAPLREALRRAYRRFGRARARKLKAVLGRVLLGLQKKGLLLAIYEREQSVFHLTVAREVKAPAPWAPGGTGGATRPPGTRRLYANAESELSDIDNDLEDLAETSAGDSLAALRRARDRLWKQLSRLESASASERPAVRAGLQKGLADLEGRIERARIDATQQARAVEGHVRTHLHEMDRAISQLEGLERAGSSAAGAPSPKQVAALRAQHDALERRLKEVRGTTGETFEEARAKVADAVARLETDLQAALRNAS